MILGQTVQLVASVHPRFQMRVANHCRRGEIHKPKKKVTLWVVSFCFAKLQNPESLGRMGAEPGHGSTCACPAWSVHSEEIRKRPRLGLPYQQVRSPSDKNKHGELHTKKNCMCETVQEGENCRAGLWRSLVLVLPRQRACVMPSQAIWLGVSASCLQRLNSREQLPSLRPFLSLRAASTHITINKAN